MPARRHPEQEIQRSVVSHLRCRGARGAAGGFASEAVGLDAAIRCLESWGVLRGLTQ